MGMSGVLIQHMPLSILYASIDSIKAGFEIDLVDVRLFPKQWKEIIRSKITPDTILAGISVMTGSPIRNALEITTWIKHQYPQIKIVWGGPHATFNGTDILDEPDIDFVICGYGSLPLSRLAIHIRENRQFSALSEINGLLYRNRDSVVAVPPEDKFEVFDYRDIPYHLIKEEMNRYGQLDSRERIFSLYSVMGCPYKCAFCSSPAQYKNIKIKYEPFSSSEVADHIEYVCKEYNATYIYFIDDDSFVYLDHVERIIDEINKRGLAVRLGFRGARINEIKKMSDEYLDKLAKAGTNIFHIGAESGSQRILNLMRKNCTVEDIVAVNKKMARHPEIKTAYNWIVGLPGETVDDLHATRRLISRLIEDNRNAIIFIPNKYRPLPGTELYDHAVNSGYLKPRKLEDWIEMEAEGDYRQPWYTKDSARMINMMQITSYFIDDKILKLETGNTLKYRIIRVMAMLYSPIAKFRFKHGLVNFLVEYRLFRWFSSLFRS
jgi:anaerobic magnesium-protoporphyrin IX monomethyl ester cyclase